MYRVGILRGVKGNEVTFELDESLDLERLRQISPHDYISAEVKFADKRRISPEQRRKAYVLIREVANYSGYSPLEAKEQMKIEYILRTGGEWISLSDCTMTEAREFISIVIEFCFEFNIPFREKGIHLTDDISRYLFLCIKHRKCVVCGKRADIHHVDTVGMGSNRRKVDNTENRLMALCRGHHKEVHKRGQEEFDKIHLVQGIKVNKETLKSLGL